MVEEIFYPRQLEYLENNIVGPLRERITKLEKRVKELEEEVIGLQLRHVKIDAVGKEIKK